MLLHRCCDDLGLPVRRKTGQTYQDHSVARLVLTEDQLSEVLVRSQEKGTILSSPPKHQLVRQPWVELGDIGHLVPILPKALDDLAINAFVGDELHAASLGMG